MDSWIASAVDTLKKDLTDTCLYMETPIVDLQATWQQSFICFIDCPVTILHLSNYTYTVVRGVYDWAAVALYETLLKLLRKGTQTINKGTMSLGLATVTHGFYIMLDE